MCIPILSGWCSVLWRPVDVIIIEGHGSLRRQQELKQADAVKTLHSRHLTGYVVDLAPWGNHRVLWHN